MTLFVSLVPLWCLKNQRMSDTYKARLKGNYVEWTDGQPVTADQDREVDVLITVLYEAQTPLETLTQRGERMAQCLEKIAQIGGIRGIADPVA